MRRARGYTLIFVMLILLVLTIAATAYFTSASRGQYASMVATAKQLAVARAQYGAQRTVLEIRNNTVVPTALTPRAAPLDFADCVGSGNCIAIGPVNAGSTLDLASGGGLQYDCIVFKLNQIGSPPNRYVIRSTGYFGYTATSVTGP